MEEMFYLITDLLRDNNDYLTTNEIAKEIGTSRQVVQRYLRIIRFVQSQGKLKTAIRDKKVKWYVEENL